MHVDMIDYFTAQRDLLSVPTPLLGIKMPQDRARLGIFICPICPEYGTRWTIPTWAHLITHIQRHHSGRRVDKKLAKVSRKSKIRMFMRPSRYPDYSHTTEEMESLTFAVTSKLPARGQTRCGAVQIILSRSRLVVVTGSGALRLTRIPGQSRRQIAFSYTHIALCTTTP